MEEFREDLRKEFKNAKIWADIKFVPADPKREVITESTKRETLPESKWKRIGYHVKEIFNILTKI